MSKLHKLFADFDSALAALRSAVFWPAYGDETTVKVRIEYEDGENWPVLDENGVVEMTAMELLAFYHHRGMDGVWQSKFSELSNAQWAKQNPNDPLAKIYLK